MADYFEEARQTDTTTASTEPIDTTTLATTSGATLTEGPTLMAYPPGVSLATITIGAGRTMFGTPPKLISATVTPIFKGTPHVVHATSGWAFYPTPQTFRVENGEELTFELPHVNADGWRDTAGNEFPALLESGERDRGWAYHAKFTVVGGSGQDSVPHRYEKVFQPLVGQTEPIDIDLVPDGQIGEPVSAPAATVTDFMGLSGSIQKEDLEAVGLGTVSDADLASYLQDPATETGAALAAAIPNPLQWQSSRAFDVTQPPRRDDMPTVIWAASDATKLTSPVEYKPSILGTGTKVTGWDGQNDPVFAFAPGRYASGWGANNDRALEGEMKPGGSSQYAGWPMIFSVNTSATDTLELAFQGPVSGMGIMFEVNGRLIDDTMRRAPSNISGSTLTVTLTFPTPAARRIRVWAGYSPSFVAARVPTGHTLSKPSLPSRTVAAIGDSFVNGAGSSGNYPDQGASLLETFAPRLLRTLGYERMMLAGIGGTGWQTANPFSDRVPVALSANPSLIVFFGSVNDGGNPAGLKTSVANTLAQVAAVPQVIVIPPGVPGYEGATQQIKEATLEAGRTYIDWHPFFTGTGKVTAPAGDGNRDMFIMGDGTHPTLDGHRAMARTLFELIVK